MTNTPASDRPRGSAQDAPAPARFRGEGIASVSPAVLSTLRCPLTRGRLLPMDEHHLMSDAPYREGVHPVYEVTDGIPHLLPAQGLPAQGPAAPAGR